MSGVVQPCQHAKFPAMLSALLAGIIVQGGGRIRPSRSTPHFTSPSVILLTKVTVFFSHLGAQWVFFSPVQGIHKYVCWISNRSFLLCFFLACVEQNIVPVRHGCAVSNYDLYNPSTRLWIVLRFYRTCQQLLASYFWCRMYYFFPQFGHSFVPYPKFTWKM